MRDSGGLAIRIGGRRLCGWPQIRIGGKPQIARMVADEGGAGAEGERRSRAKSAQRAS